MKGYLLLFSPGEVLFVALNLTGDWLGNFRENLNELPLKVIKSDKNIDIHDIFRGFPGQKSLDFASSCGHHNTLIRDNITQVFNFFCVKGRLSD